MAIAMKDFTILNTPDVITDVGGIFDPYHASLEDVYLAQPPEGPYPTARFDPIVGRKAVVVDRRAVGIHTHRYGVLQHSQLAETAQGLIDTYPELVEGATTAFTRGWGQKAVIGLKLRHGVDVDGSGRTDMLFNLANDHGGGAAKGLLSNRRWFCLNQYTAMIVRARAQFSIRHTSNVEAFFVDAAEALFCAVEERKEIEEAVARLCEQSYTDWQFESMTRDLFGERPDDDKRAAQVRFDDRQDRVESRWMNEHNTGTKWGALMAIQGYEQHEKPIRGRTSHQDRHLNSLFFGQTPLTDKARGILVPA